MNDININKIIKSYFNLYFKDHKYYNLKNLNLYKEDVIFKENICK